MDMDGLPTQCGNGIGKNLMRGTIKLLMDATGCLAGKNVHDDILLGGGALLVNMKDFKIYSVHSSEGVRDTGGV